MLFQESANSFSYNCTLWSIFGPCLCTKSCKTTFYAHLSRIWKLTRFMHFIRKVFATKILLSGKFSLFVTLTKIWWIGLQKHPDDLQWTPQIVKGGEVRRPIANFHFFGILPLVSFFFAKFFWAPSSTTPPPKKKKCVISILHLSLLKAILVALKEVAIGSVHPSMVEKITCFQNTSMYGFPHFWITSPSQA